jgi:16S rRNA C967 or C1407 C5-methylase (RsmB/RsmF family)
MLCSDSFIKDWCEINKDNLDMQGKEGRIQTITDQTFENLKFNNYEFYPRKLLYELPLSRGVLRKDAVLTSIHKFVQRSNDSGLLTRQEIVSMIPPLLLDVKPGHRIYDACAAPGSKTAQLLEFSLTGVKGKELVMNPGFVIANDADESRANMLAHQMSRFNYGCIGKYFNS